MGLPKTNAAKKKVSRSLSTDDVRVLGRTLQRVADKYPGALLTEQDFYPLVLAHLETKVPKLTTEFKLEDGRADFRIGGTNPVLLELAVAPRRLCDPDHPELLFPGHQSKKTTELYGSKNEAELRKLFRMAQSVAKMRFLLLLDLRGQHTQPELQKTYVDVTKKIASTWSSEKMNAVRVVYVAPNSEFSFALSDPRKAARRLAATSPGSQPASAEPAPTDPPSESDCPPRPE